ncbi:MAG TPA: hypothetical protein VFV78_11040 [Vicinamibacterales bacterium]|nr:hypothetical protein [Vicinamibacterales bacterium]
MTVRPPVFRVFPAISGLTVLLLAPAVGSAHWGFQVPNAGRVVAQAPPPQGRGQTPPASGAGASGQQGQRQPPTAEQILGGGRTQWWKDDAIKKEMKLTDMQARQISVIFDNRLKEITPWVEEYNRQFAELDKMSRERTVDTNVFAIQVGKVEALRSRLNETRTVMLYRINRVLDPAQYKTLQEIRDRGGRGRGGAPGPR